MSQSYLSISVGDESALVQYVSGSDVLVSHTHNHGIKHLESNAMNAQSVSKFSDNGSLYSLIIEFARHLSVPRLLYSIFISYGVSLSFSIVKAR